MDMIKHFKGRPPARFTYRGKVIPVAREGQAGIISTEDKTLQQRLRRKGWREREAAVPKQPAEVGPSRRCFLVETDGSSPREFPFMDLREGHHFVLLDECENPVEDGTRVLRATCRAFRSEEGVGTIETEKEPVLILDTPVHLQLAEQPSADPPQALGTEE